MSLETKYLARKRKQNSKPIKAEVSLGHVQDSLLPMLYHLRVLKPNDQVQEIEFDWHNIKDGICPISIHIKGKESTKTND